MSNFTWNDDEERNEFQSKYGEEFVNAVENASVQDLAALAYFEIEPEDVAKVLEEIQDDDENYTYKGVTIRVLDDFDADKALEDYAENYIDEVIFACNPEMERYRRYFNEDSFIEDFKMDGRGNALSGYDGNELEFDKYLDIDFDETMFVYRN